MALTGEAATAAIRRAVAVLAFGGALVFGAASVWSFVDPVGVERVARDAIAAELQGRVDATIDGIAVPAGLDGGTLAAIAGRVAERGRVRIEATRARWRAMAPDAVEVTVALMLTPDCGCRDTPAERADAVEATLDGMFAASVAGGESIVERLEALARAGYRDVAAQLLREFRIFSATNAVVLLLLGIGVTVRRGAGVHLLPAALVVVAASAAVSYGYLFGQDWLRTIVFGDYMGLAFVAYVAVVAALLADLLFNKARITARLLEALSSAIVPPC